MLTVLAKFPGGGASRAEVLRAMEAAFADAWTDDDLASPAKHPTETNWENRASFERANMVREGLLKHSTPRRWVLAAAQDPDRGVSQTRGDEESSLHSARLSDLTDPNAIEAALAEYRILGREGFLAKYGLKPSLDYFVRVGDEFFDSKPLLAVAYAYQFPSRGTLPVSAFSGGSTGAVRILQRFGYETTTRAQVDPPILGTSFPDRDRKSVV